MTKIHLVIAACLLGCTMNGRLADGQAGKDMRCENTNTGEVFFFNTDDVTDIRIGVGDEPDTATIKDSTGRMRTGSSAHNSFMNCGEA